ncbi:MAG: class I SAM-dependent methyltransferase, partial [Ruminococcus sp.]|nr:class I SAM-dependent methyltransferase [Ruminococcus sp.]
DMLSLAMQKCIEAGESVLFVQQEMQALTLPETVDTCVCTLDSINHLTDEKDVQRAFERISRYMNAGGLFIFDVNTVYKHREVLADNVFVMENEHVFCVWQNFPREDDIVDVALDFFAEENGVYRRSSEDFSERAYSDAQLRGMLAQAGFAVLAVYGDLCFDAPAPDAQRAIYIAQKQ